MEHSLAIKLLQSEMTVATQGSLYVRDVSITDSLFNLALHSMWKGRLSDKYHSLQMAVSFGVTAPFSG
jgi:hypothetical protein